ncbi:MAG: cyclic nucleotide-binding domain-containing protein [Candidatus Lindowbacteria bacterium]|nr:cyclic nucleotide-binding domain-containing protein [Candidatus Lindowbacteria bacterium]
MAQGVEKIEYRLGDVLFSKGEDSSEIYILETGGVEITINGDNLAYITDPGSYIGEMAYLLDSPRAATATAIEDSTLLVIKAESVEQAMAANPKLALKLAKTLATRLTDTNSILADFLHQSVFHHKGQDLNEFMRNLPIGKMEEITSHTMKHHVLSKKSGIDFEKAGQVLRGFELLLDDLKRRNALTFDTLNDLALEYNINLKVKQEVEKLFDAASS